MPWPVVPDALLASIEDCVATARAHGEVEALADLQRILTNLDARSKGCQASDPPEPVSNRVCSPEVRRRGYVSGGAGRQLGS